MRNSTKSPNYFKHLWTILLLLCVIPTSSIAQQPQPFPHPETGAAGFWVPREDLIECTACFDDVDSYEQELIDLEENHDATVALYESRIADLKQRQWWELAIAGVIALLAIIGIIT